MTITQTSLLAYAEAQQNPGNKQLGVYEMIRHYGPMCNQWIASRLNWPINTVTPRVQELRKKGLVKKDHVGRDPHTGRLVIYWSINN